MKGRKNKKNNSVTNLELLESVLKEEGWKYEIQGPDPSDGSYYFFVTFDGEIFMINTLPHNSFISIAKMRLISEMMGVQDGYHVMRAVNRVNQQIPQRTYYFYTDVDGKKELVISTITEIIWIPGMPSQGEYLRVTFVNLNKAQSMLKDILSRHKETYSMPVFLKCSPYIA